jgi:hypothetical protein
MALPESGYGLSSTHRHEFGIGIFQPLLLIDRDKPVSLLIIKHWLTATPSLDYMDRNTRDNKARFSWHRQTPFAVKQRMASNH